ncbi:MAG: phosphate acyltransferase PlsX [Ignavibacteriaceae bacterium]|nr:phosphate acyltransferase PlsX [Ignavibacteriaceae bacterium]
MSNSDSDKTRCRIIVDAMGGDFAPYSAVVGAIQASTENSKIELYLVGKSEEILKIISSNNLSFNKENIINADEVIGMAEGPTASLKAKPNSSIVVGTKLVHEKKADAFVSAGNTGAVMAAATLIIGRIPGVGRPTIGQPMPNTTGISTLFDVGASVDSKPRHLLEYAIMGTIFTKEIYGIENPKVGVLSVGEEEAKGNEVTIAAAALIKKTNLNFVGNVEGRDILKGTVHVVVCDGFVGNIVLKFGESVLDFLKYKFKDYAKKSLINKLKIGLVKGSMKEILKDFDYQEYGGVPLLGVNGISIIGHGSSTPKAIKNMVFRAYEMYQKDLILKIENSIRQYSNLT